MPDESDMTTEAGIGTDARSTEARRVDELQAENAELRRRVEVAEAEIAELRAEALERRAAVRSLAESLPAVMSRSTLLRAMAADARHHPDKAGVAKRAVRKLGRAPRKAARMLRDLVRRPA